jgi:F-type H+-transporting ATPase subunit gamma
MASLKEIRSRIISVTSTRKITSAMKMVSAAKLKKAQNAIDNSLPYLSKLTTILENYVASLEGESLSPLTEIREEKKVAIIAISSNGSLCGAFNNNIIKQFEQKYSDYARKIGRNNIKVYPIGRKIREAIDKLKIENSLSKKDLSADNLDYAAISALADELMVDFTQNNIDKVEFIYNHFKNAAVQQVRCETILPFAPTETEKKEQSSVDYIVEPSSLVLVSDLIPKVVKLQLFSGLLDSIAGEHGARTTAMQIATENADELIQNLKLSYNKLRQTAITTEIITITGGAEALR